MATKDERPGLLSKVAMFVRNPTKDWSELDQLDARATVPQESAQDRQALKDMIERKRQNDFIRRREFDQLRKLRNRAPGTSAAPLRPSFFQNSMPIEEEGRSVTLKKIDEIEAQMSKQWWEGKQAGTATGQEKAPESTLPMETPAPAQRAEAEGGQVSASQLPFATTQLLTQPGVDAAAASDFSSTQSVSDLMKLEMARNQEIAAARNPNPEKAAPSFGFALSIPGALDESVPEPDSDLEEAAIRYANGDDAGAEQCLLTALRTPSAELHYARAHAEALLDYYRTKGSRAEFENAVAEFARHLPGTPPGWGTEAAPPLLAASANAEPRSTGGAAATKSLPPMTWACPPELNGVAMDALRDVLLDSPQPWTIDWSELQRIAPDALKSLDDFFASLCEETLELRFFEGDRLVQTLRSYVASGNQSIDDLWWKTRLNVLRVLSMQDDFELAALDYCVNLGVAPPVWQAAQCDCKALTAKERAAFAPIQADYAATEPPQQSPVLPTAVASSPLQLSGELLGDVGPALALLDLAAAGQAVVAVQCDGLRRVDFAAAGSILNWVANRQSEGLRVQFLNVNRLVAAFFGVIGIHENAKVVLRPV